MLAVGALSIATEPISLYSHRVDPQGVLQALKRVAVDFALEGTPAQWTQVIACGPRRLLRKRMELRIGHAPSHYYSWARQLHGMAEYFGRFPDVPRKADILRAVHGFQFSLSLAENTDLDLHGTDARLEWVYEIVRHLDGMIVTPTALRDAGGRILISSWGEFDEQATLPQFIPTDDEIRTQLADVTGEPDSDNEVEIKPPTLERVVRRAMVLTAVSQRGLLENERKNPRAAELQRTGYLEWLAALRLEDEVEPDEWKVLQRKAGALEPQAMINAIWRVEGLAVLAWALHLAEMPVYDELCIPLELANAMGFPESDQSLAVMQAATLRTAEELKAMNHQLLALHWRVRNQRLNPEPMNFVAFSKNCWFGGFDLEPFRMLENDLAIGAKPISRCDPELLGRTASAAMERHLAINWLRGQSRIYSETDTST
ncbi:MAG TPA: DUF4272 domain-containing protein [Planctomycetaceae bacterium]|nr:DUF4272 domain-containing protein [Planctomycetaceae bacterium]